MRFAPLQGLLLPNLPASCDLGTSPGISCRSAHTFRKSPHTPEASTLRVKGRVQGSFALFTVYSSFGLVGLFHPTNALRLRPSRGFPLEKQAPTHRRSLPPCRSSVADLRRLPTPTSWRFLSGVRTVRSDIIRASQPIPSWASSPPGCSIVAMRQFITVAPPWCFIDRHSERLPGQRCGRRHFGVSIASVAPSPLSRRWDPPEVFGHQSLSMKQLCGSGLWFHRGSRVMLPFPAEPLRAHLLPTGA